MEGAWEPFLAGWLWVAAVGGCVSKAVHLGGLNLGGLGQSNRLHSWLGWAWLGAGECTGAAPSRNPFTHPDTRVIGNDPRGQLQLTEPESIRDAWRYRAPSAALKYLGRAKLGLWAPTKPALATRAGSLGVGAGMWQALGPPTKRYRLDGGCSLCVWS